LQGLNFSRSIGDMGRTNDMMPVLLMWCSLVDHLGRICILVAFDTPIGHKQKHEFERLQPYEYA